MSKSMSYAILEAVQGEMRRSELLTLLYEYQRPAARWEGRSIDLEAEFGQPRIRFCAIDENWIVGSALGMSMIGVPAIAHIPSMATFIPYELMFNHAGKLRHMTGGQAAFPMVLWADMARRSPRQGGQHADAGLESSYARLAGLKVVIPSTPYDAKGLMISAIRDVDPVVFCHYPVPASGPEVPDEPYTVPIGEAAVRTEGSDLTIVGYAPQTVEIAKAVRELEKDGISAEFIDPRTLAPLEGPMETIVESVKKTGKLLTSDEGSYNFCNCSEIIARVAEAVPGVRVKRLAFPDAPPPGAPEMIDYMKVDASNIVDAAKKLVKA
ncbi:MAG TPA: transketolase C-terminal domain-containing protein [Thermoguttaceae bacterium]|nr:transketolase C-terminal domain-containing protein [Thermoguttaceae bacterium]